MGAGYLSMHLLLDRFNFYPGQTTASYSLSIVLYHVLGQHLYHYLQFFISMFQCSNDIQYLAVFSFQKCNVLVL